MPACITDLGQLGSRVATGVPIIPIRDINTSSHLGEAPAAMAICLADREPVGWPVIVALADISLRITDIAIQPKPFNHPCLTGISTEPCP